MWKLVLFLLFTLLVVPIVAFSFDVPPTADQWQLMQTLGLMYIISAGLTFGISTATGNYSQVDKLWSVIPVAYAWVVAVGVHFEPRVVLMAVLVSLWGARLTFNFARRGGYSGGYSWKFWEGEEDYRWAVLRAKPEFQGRGRWLLFNLFFISFYQMGLILLFTMPIVKASGGAPLGVWDYVLAAVFVLLLLVETVADQQQWTYQTEKHRRIKAGEPLTAPYSQGFVHTGLWAWVHHPNYSAEQLIWITFYLFTLSAGGYGINWSIAGCLLLVLLFYGSSNFSEEISASKYPAYPIYQRRTGRFFPKLSSLRPPAPPLGQAAADPVLHPGSSASNPSFDP